MAQLHAFPLPKLRCRLSTKNLVTAIEILGAAYSCTHMLPDAAGARGCVRGLLLDSLNAPQEVRERMHEVGEARRS
jgi:hypothetical protein